VTLVVWLGVAAMFIAVIALAAWSDRRDRRLGIDPSDRAESLGRRRQLMREQGLMRRLTRSTADDDGPGRPRRGPYS